MWPQEFTGAIFCAEFQRVRSWSRFPVTNDCACGESHANFTNLLQLRMRRKSAQIQNVLASRICLSCCDRSLMLYTELAHISSVGLASSTCCSCAVPWVMESEHGISCYREHSCLAHSIATRQTSAGPSCNSITSVL
ncbi:hypothetical protein XELAEV_18022620mg [Xenopus laevis]|uniref:Uncharacterized protein n=1 Tax=Xenopus laevis TaxID=8355 RepID=A0A974HNC2_XENLA|nr:hypothetical protein XELAEV_18022620mg [Xenopus laevis]